jgi:hypothetical protein
MLVVAYGNYDYFWLEHNKQLFNLVNRDGS